MDDIPLKNMTSGERMSGGEAQPLRPSQDEDTHDEDGYDEDVVDDFIAKHDNHPELAKYARIRLFWSFMAFGLLNNVLYVIILSAALDLVSSTTPKGIVAFFAVFPSLLAKVVWPLISNGKIQYTKRVCFCTAVSWSGIVIVAISAGLYPRLFGIALASLSSGLGEVTFLQLSTTLPNRSSSKTALGAWSSGTGLAGVGGAAIWWLLRGLGVKGGLGISSILPLFFPLIYFVLLPPWSHLKDSNIGSYEPLSSAPDTTPVTPPSVFTSLPENSTSKPTDLRLSTKEKMALLRPLVLRYMLPLCLVYIEEYLINSGVAPTLVFPLPTYGPWSKLFKTPRDYYPFWSLTYQTFVFISRSSLSLGIPHIPKPFLPLPTIIQGLVLLILSLQASSFILSSQGYTPPNTPPSAGVDNTITKVFFLICLEGLCGGSAYVNTFYHVGHEGHPEAGTGVEGDGDGEDDEKTKMEREFRIGATGAADSTGILLASLISMPTELALCRSQVEKGRTMCRDL